MTITLQLSSNTATYTPYFDDNTSTQFNTATQTQYITDNTGSQFHTAAQTTHIATTATEFIHKDKNSIKLNDYDKVRNTNTRQPIKDHSFKKNKTACPQNNAAQKSNDNQQSTEPIYHEPVSCANKEGIKKKTPKQSKNKDHRPSTTSLSPQASTSRKTTQHTPPLYEAEFDFTTNITNRNMRLVNVRDDGHCFLYALIVSMHSQHPQLSHIRYEDLLSHIDNNHHYHEENYPGHGGQQTIDNSEQFYKDKKRYLKEKLFNHDYGDIVANSMVKLLNKCHIYTVEDKDDSTHSVTRLQLENNDKAPAVYINKKGQHYRAIVKNDSTISPQNLRFLSDYEQRIWSSTTHTATTATEFIHKDKNSIKLNDYDKASNTNTRQPIQDHSFKTNKTACPQNNAAQKSNDNQQSTEPIYHEPVSCVNKGGTKKKTPKHSKKKDTRPSTTTQIALSPQASTSTATTPDTLPMCDPDFNITTNITNKNMSLVDVRGDGHCFLYAFIVSMHSQHPQLSHISYEELLSHIEENHHYQSHLEAGNGKASADDDRNFKDFYEEKKLYLREKRFNHNYGDLVANSMVKLLNTCHIYTVEYQNHSKHQLMRLELANNVNAPTVYIYKTGQHYRAIINNDSAISPENLRFLPDSIRGYYSSRTSTVSQTQGTKQDTYSKTVRTNDTDIMKYYHAQHRETNPTLQWTMSYKEEITDKNMMIRSMSNNKYSLLRAITSSIASQLPHLRQFGEESLRDMLYEYGTYANLNFYNGTSSDFSRDKSNYLTFDKSSDDFEMVLPHLISKVLNVDLHIINEEINDKRKVTLIPSDSNNPPTLYISRRGPYYDAIVKERCDKCHCTDHYTAHCTTFPYPSHSQDCIVQNRKDGVLAKCSCTASNGMTNSSYAAKAKNFVGTTLNTLQKKTKKKIDAIKTSVETTSRNKDSNAEVGVKVVPQRKPTYVPPVPTRYKVANKTTPYIDRTTANAANPKAKSHTKQSHISVNGQGARTWNYVNERNTFIDVPKIKPRTTVRKDSYDCAYCGSNQDHQIWECKTDEYNNILKYPTLRSKHNPFHVSIAQYQVHQPTLNISDSQPSHNTSSNLPARNRTLLNHPNNSTLDSDLSLLLTHDYCNHCSGYHIPGECNIAQYKNKFPELGRTRQQTKTTAFDKLKKTKTPTSNIVPQATHTKGDCLNKSVTKKTTINESKKSARNAKKKLVPYDSTSQEYSIPSPPLPHTDSNTLSNNDHSNLLSQDPNAYIHSTPTIAPQLISDKDKLHDSIGTKTNTSKTNDQPLLYQSLLSPIDNRNPDIEQTISSLSECSISDDDNTNAVKLTKRLYPTLPKEASADQSGQETTQQSDSVFNYSGEKFTLEERARNLINNKNNPTQSLYPTLQTELSEVEIQSSTTKQAGTSTTEQSSSSDEDDMVLSLRLLKLRNQAKNVNVNSEDINQSVPSETSNHNSEIEQQIITSMSGCGLSDDNTLPTASTQIKRLYPTLPKETSADHSAHESSQQSDSVFNNSGNELTFEASTTNLNNNTTNQTPSLYPSLHIELSEQQIQNIQTDTSTTKQSNSKDEMFLSERLRILRNQSKVKNDKASPTVLKQTKKLYPTLPTESCAEITNIDTSPMSQSTSTNMYDDITRQDVNTTHKSSKSQNKTAHTKHDKKPQHSTSSNDSMSESSSSQQMSTIKKRKTTTENAVISAQMRTDIQSPKHKTHHQSVSSMSESATTDDYRNEQPISQNMLESGPQSSFTVSPRISPQYGMDKQPLAHAKNDVNMSNANPSNSEDDIPLATRRDKKRKNKKRGKNAGTATPSSSSDSTSKQSKKKSCHGLENINKSKTKLKPSQPKQTKNNIKSMSESSTTSISEVEIPLTESKQSKNKNVTKQNNKQSAPHSSLRVSGRHSPDDEVDSQPLAERKDNNKKANKRKKQMTESSTSEMENNLKKVPVLKKLKNMLECKHCSSIHIPGMCKPTKRPSKSSKNIIQSTDSDASSTSSLVAGNLMPPPIPRRSRRLASSSDSSLGRSVSHSPPTRRTKSVL